MKKVLFVLCFAVPSLFGQGLENNGGYTISDVTVRQRWPWERKVDIDFYLDRPAGAPADKLVKIDVLATNAGSPVAISDAALSRKYFFADGACRIVWDPVVDHKNESFNSLAVTLCVTETNLAPTYMTVNLVTGGLAYYPASFSNSVNADLYKTTYMAFRRCPATTSAEWLAMNGGTNYFIMGEGVPTNDSVWNVADSPTNVILTQDFYMGVFEVTQYQYEKIKGSNPSSYYFSPTYPVQNLSYEAIRGVDATNRWPTTSEVSPTNFMGILRTLTGKQFDLPTEAQWEYACRAGTKGVRYFDDARQGSYLQISGGLKAVGSFLPNPWGLCNMLDSVHEWTLTLARQTSSETPYPIDGGTDPVGPVPTVATPYRYIRSCHFMPGDNAWKLYSRSTMRAGYRVDAMAEQSYYSGFRVCLTIR